MLKKAKMKIDIACVLWMDNRLVSLISTTTGSNLVKEIQRFDRRSEKPISVQRLKIVKQYNKYMRGIG